MDPQMNLNCSCRPCKFEVDVILVILIVSLSFIIGLLIGAFTGLVALLGLGALIAIAVILGILILARAIMLYSRCCIRRL